jgi:hypothetical protein
VRNEETNRENEREGNIDTKRERNITGRNKKREIIGL